MATIVVAAVLTLTGCESGVLDNPYEQPSESESAKAAATLSTLPSLEDTETRVKGAVEQLAEFISTLVPRMQWTQMGDRMVSGCDRPYSRTYGRKVFLKDYVAEGNIPDEVWPQIFERTKELAAALGATGLERFHDKPGLHDVRFYSREGTAIHLGSAGNTVIDAVTGCRLPQAKMTETPPPQAPHP